MKDTPSGQTKGQHLGIVVNSVINCVLLLLVIVYFIYIFIGVKFRLNWQSRLKMVFIGVAFTSRAGLSLYDCFVSFDKIIS